MHRKDHWTRLLVLHPGYILESSKQFSTNTKAPTAPPEVLTAPLMLSGSTRIQVSSNTKH